MPLFFFRMPLLDESAGIQTGLLVLKILGEATGVLLSKMFGEPLALFFFRFIPLLRGEATGKLVVVGGTAGDVGVTSGVLGVALLLLLLFIIPPLALSRTGDATELGRLVPAGAGTTTLPPEFFLELFLPLLLSL